MRSTRTTSFRQAPLPLQIEAESGVLNQGDALAVARPGLSRSPEARSWVTDPRPYPNPVARSELPVDGSRFRDILAVNFKTRRQPVRVERQG